MTRSRSLIGSPHEQVSRAHGDVSRGWKGAGVAKRRWPDSAAQQRTRRSRSSDDRERLKVPEAAGHQGKWYTLEEAREIRRKAGMGVDF